MMSVESVESYIQTGLRPGDLENKYISRYINHKKAQLIECPLCNLMAESYTELNHHLSHDHDEKETEKEIEKLLYVINPVQKIRDLEVMKPPKMSNPMTIGKFFGDIITSDHNQNCLLNIIGKQGTGKSNAAGYIAKCVSEYVAAKKGGVPEDYFTIENIAIMRMETILPILRQIDKKKYNIFIFDDIGGEWGARSAQTKQNKEVNKIIQTFRDSNTLCIFTVPDLFLMDKVGRKLAHYQIEMSYTLFEQGVTIGKLKVVRERYQHGETYFAFPVIENVQYKRIMFKRMPEELAEAYESRRIEIRRKYTKESIKKMSGDPGDAEGTDKPKKYQAVSGIVNQQLIDFPEKSIRQISKDLKLPYYTTSQAVKFIRGEL
jgi:hypothetical protein